MTSGLEVTDEVSDQAPASSSARPGTGCTPSRPSWSSPSDDSTPHGKRRQSMTASDVETSEPKAMGPISYLVVEFPGSKMTGQGFSALVDLVDRGLIRILDLRFVTRDPDGSIRALELADIDRDGRFDL